MPLLLDMNAGMNEPHRGRLEIYMKTIAIIDDDVPVGDLLTELFEREGYAVLRAYSGTEALYLITAHRPDVILLDLMLPGLDGASVLPHIRRTPVIVLSAKADVKDKVAMLRGGAVDYVTKPFDTAELLARVETALRRSAEEAAAVPLTVGTLSLDPLMRTAEAKGTCVKLTRTEYAILKLLMSNPDRAFSRGALLDQIAFDTPDCTERSLKQHISNLRAKLRAASGEDYIETVWGIGFKLTSKT